MSCPLGALAAVQIGTYGLNWETLQIRRNASRLLLRLAEDLKHGGICAPVAREADLVDAALKEVPMPCGVRTDPWQHRPRICPLGRELKTFAIGCDDGSVPAGIALAQHRQSRLLFIIEAQRNELPLIQVLCV